jgi:hypothetical protein
MTERDHSASEDQFADALDAMTLGVHRRESLDSPLAIVAASIQGIGGHVATGNESVPTPPLDRTTKSRIWSELMLAHGGAPDLATTPQVPGASGASLSLNPWVGEQSRSCPKRPVSSSRVLRFVPAAQPASSFLLVIAVLVLIGGTFAGLAPDDGRGVFPSAHATEDSAQLDFASPEASPSVAECTIEPLTTAQIEHVRETGNTQPLRAYTPVTAPDELATSEAVASYAMLSACSDQVDDEAEISLLWALMTDRALLENPLGIRIEDQLTRSREVSEQFGEALLGLRPTDEELELIGNRSGTSDYPFSSEIMHLFDPSKSVVRLLPDGRLAMYSVDVWLRRDGRNASFSSENEREIVQYTILGNPRYGGGIDELLYVCLGQCDIFWTEWEVQTFGLPATPGPALPNASPAADFNFLSPVIPEDCSVDSRPVGQIWAFNDDPVAQIEREYGPVFLAETPLSIDIANAARVWRACSAHGYPSQRLAMESPRFIHESGGSDFLNWDMDEAEEQQIAIQLLADEVLDGDWTPYYVGTALLGDIDAGTGVYTLRDDRSFLLPQHVYQLPDGRFGGLVTKLVPLGYVESMSVSPDHNVEFQIYAQDPTQDGRWVLDETLWLCATGCDILTGKSKPDSFGATPVTIHIP